MHMICQPREGIWPGSSRKALGVLREYKVDRCLLVALR